VTKYTFRHLSPEGRRAYQRELLRILEYRNASPTKKRWGVGRADRCTALKAGVGDLRGQSLEQLCKEMEKDFFMAGRELLAAVPKEVAADA
jgi:hypothetical protein